MYDHSSRSNDAEGADVLAAFRLVNGYSHGKDCGPKDHNMAAAVRLRLKELQQQNAALLKVLERERQSSDRSKQQVR